MSDQENKENETPENNETVEASAAETTTESTQETRSDESYHVRDENEIYPSGIWMRALHMIIFMILFGVAETLLFFMAIFQFLWMLFTKKRNPSIAQFGDMVSAWLRDVGRFQSGATDDKPFPWSDMK